VDKFQYLQTFKSIRDSVPLDRRDNFDLQFGGREKDPAVALILSFVLGMFAGDRFYLGHVGIGILKLITLGGFYIWVIVDWFLIMGAARRQNIKIARQAAEMVGR
jgi:TM2 domain-containing membrane protein YozV